MVSRRTRLKPQEKPAPGVLRTTADTGWRVTVGPRVLPLMAGFADRRHGGRATALRLANSASKLFHKELGLPFVKRYTPSNAHGKKGRVRGVSACERGWMVTIMPTPNQRIRRFVHRNKGYAAAVALRDQLFRDVYHLTPSMETVGGHVQLKPVSRTALKERRRALLKRLTPKAQPRG